MINEEIRDKEVRLIDEDGGSLGIVSSREAQRIASDRGLDLVKIAPLANPPVCKVMDYDKYVFDMIKKEKEQKKNQKVVNIKEIKLSLEVGDHDFQVKAKSAVKFLQDGDKVKVTVKFVGREMNHTYSGEELIDRLVKCVSDYGVMEKTPKLEGKRMTVIINPK